MHDTQCFLPKNDAERQLLNRMVNEGKLVRPAPGIYANATWWRNADPISRHASLVRALARRHPNWVFCHTSAAVVWRLSVPYGRLAKVHVATPIESHYRNNSAVIFHRFSRINYVEHDGVRVTTCERTAIDCMRTLPLASGLAVADSAARSQGWDDLYLAQRLKEEQLPKLHGITRAKLAALLVDARSESGGESIARTNIIRAGYALPELQYEVRSRTDGRPYRVDFAWMPKGHVGDANSGQTGDAAGTPQRIIFGELDGKIKYQNSQMAPTGALDVLLAERRRESELTLASDAILRLSYEEADSITLLADKLDIFGVPRVCEPLTFTKDARHNRCEISSYLRLNEQTSESAAKRLRFLDERR